MGQFEFHAEGIEFTLELQDKVATWLGSVVEKYQYGIEAVSYVFLSDDGLLKMNVEHLNHDTYTDIITFVLNDSESKDLMVDIFISVDRVRENAQEFGQSFQDELHRVMVHGLLHAVGMDDKDADAKQEMRKAEDFALSLREF